MGEPQQRIRKAAKAGTWYSSSSNTLSQQLSIWIDQSIEETGKVVDEKRAIVKALIGPHAGYSYSGPTAAFAYSPLQASKRTVFLLGPSHHIHLSKQAALSKCTLLDTPLGPIEVDTKICKALYKSDQFTWLDQAADEDEHSLELHLPWLRHIFSRGNVSQDASDCMCKIVPIMIGCPSNEQETALATLLMPYFLDPACLFVISSDFCHWGTRFGFTSATRGIPIYKSIETMDKEGMALIEAQDYTGFKRYLATTENTICGRYPICILLRTIELSSLCEPKISLGFSKYAESSQVMNTRDSSVSYASAIAIKSRAY